MKTKRQQVIEALTEYTRNHLKEGDLEAVPELKAFLPNRIRQILSKLKRV